jgi:hypothetical protein
MEPDHDPSQAGHIRFSPLCFAVGEVVEYFSQFSQVFLMGRIEKVHLRRKTFDLELTSSHQSKSQVTVDLVRVPLRAGELADVFCNKGLIKDPTTGHLDFHRSLLSLADSAGAGTTNVLINSATQAQGTPTGSSQLTRLPSRGSPSALRAATVPSSASTTETIKNQLSSGSDDGGLMGKSMNLSKEITRPERRPSDAEVELDADGQQMPIWYGPVEVVKRLPHCKGYITRHTVTKKEAKIECTKIRRHIEHGENVYALDRFKWVRGVAVVDSGSDSRSKAVSTVGIMQKLPSGISKVELPTIPKGASKQMDFMSEGLHSTWVVTFSRSEDL